MIVFYSPKNKSENDIAQILDLRSSWGAKDYSTGMRNFTARKTMDIIAKIREILDKNNFKNIPIMAYSVKYSSAYYGPFRDAADSAPSFGDRKTYQMDFRSYNNFYREVEADTQEGADFIMVKPAMAYLDVIKSVSEVTNLPIVAYNVSGEYSMVKAAAKNNWIDEEKIVMENMYAIKRAGADIIITYHAKDIVKWLSK